MATSHFSTGFWWLNSLENSGAWRRVSCSCRPSARMNLLLVIDYSPHPVTLLSPLSPMKKGANALYIGVLSPLHPFSRKILCKRFCFSILPRKPLHFFCILFVINQTILQKCIEPIKIAESNWNNQGAPDSGGGIKYLSLRFLELENKSFLKDFCRFLSKKAGRQWAVTLHTPNVKYS